MIQAVRPTSGRSTGSATGSPSSLRIKLNFCTKPCNISIDFTGWNRSAEGYRQAGSGKSQDPLYDVEEAAFFPDHRIAFSSRREGRFRLYEVDPVSAVIKEMSVSTCPARYPAISPDGGWLGFNCGHRPRNRFSSRKAIAIPSALSGRLTLRVSSMPRIGTRSRIDSPSPIKRCR